MTPWTVACQAPLSIGIFQESILEWVAISFSRGSSWPRDQTCISYIGRKVPYHGATWEARCGGDYCKLQRYSIERHLNTHIHREKKTSKPIHEPNRKPVFTSCIISPISLTPHAHHCPACPRPNPMASTGSVSSSFAIFPGNDTDSFLKTSKDGHH